MTEPLTQLERKLAVHDVSHVGNIFIYWSNPCLSAVSVATNTNVPQRHAMS